jgi:cysteine synthase A
VNKFESLQSLVGNTPLLEITLKYKGEIRKVYAKAEYYSFSGSIKDRIAYYILKKAYQNGDIKPTDIIAEATSGNTGIAFSAIGKYLGHKVKIFMPEWMSDERKKLIRGFGAELRLVTAEEGGFEGSARLADEEAKRGGYFLPHQFINKYNVEAHYTGTAPEIERQIKTFASKVDAVAAGTGTGGTIMGICRYFKEKDKSFKAFPLEPESSAIMSGSKDLKEHKIQGIGDGFIPDIVKMNELDQPITIDEDDAIRTSQLLAKKFGLGVGISSGCNLLGVLKAQNIIGKDKVIVTTFTDDNKKYLSTDLANEIKIKDNFLSKNIEFIDIKATK